MVVLMFIVPQNSFAGEVAKVSKNLVQNSSFEKLGSNGDPVDWYRGGYGNNVRTHERVQCAHVYTEADLLDPNAPNFVFRPDCPPNTTYRLVTSAPRDTHIDGDTKWYFSDIKVQEKRSYKLSYYYQAYTYKATVFARYTMKNGSYQYQTLGTMAQLGGGNGYSGWGNGTVTINPPKEAKSFTVFFAVTPDSDCASDICIVINPSFGRLSIAGVAVTESK
jgi:hypothetical protein